LGDPKRIAQLLNKLLANALKYSPARATIHIQTEADNSNVRLSVRDEGLGIAKAEIKTLFSAFAKGSALPTANEPSYGLGLHIVKRIAKAHACSVDVTSSIGSGTQFTVSFPLETATWNTP